MRFERCRAESCIFSFKEKSTCLPAISVTGHSWRKVMTIGGNNYLYVARIVDIIVHDHVIIDKNRFFSFPEEGLI